MEPDRAAWAQGRAGVWATAVATTHPAGQIQGQVAGSTAEAVVGSVAEVGAATARAVVVAGDGAISITPPGSHVGRGGGLPRLRRMVPRMGLLISPHRKGKRLRCSGMKPSG